MNQQTIEEGKTNAIISYLTIFGTIIAFFLNNERKNEYASFHIRQALGLWLTFFALGYIVGMFDSWLMTLGFWMFFGILFIYGFVNAIAGKAQAVPLVGELYQRLFANFGR